MRDIARAVIPANAGKRLLGLLLPRICVLCSDRAAEPFNLCDGCIRDLPGMAGACRRCALPLPLPGPGLCARCAAAPPPFRRAVAAFRYVEPVDTLIQQLKYQGDLAVAPTLGRLLALRIAEAGTGGAECILPVPLHPRRLRARGFNQSLEIAKALAAGTGIPVKRYRVKRTRDTPVQSQTPGRSRAAAERARGVHRFAPARPIRSRCHRRRRGHHRGYRGGARPGHSCRRSRER